MNLLDRNRFILYRDYVPNEMEEDILFYRYTDPYYSNTDEPYLLTYKAYKETPQGYWIVPYHDHRGTEVDPRSRKWIKKISSHDRTPRKLFVYKNKEDALYSYYRRKLEHMRYIEVKHNKLKSIVRKIENENDFFGAQRPIVSNINDFIQLPWRKIKPLEREKPRHDFIREMEMEL